MVDLGLVLPPGHRLVTVAEDPSLRAPMGEHNVAVWPEFMLHDPVADRLWDRLFTTWPEFQVALLAPDGSVVAAHNSAPLRWDGMDDGLPHGWDAQFEQSAADADRGIEPNTLGATQIVVAPAAQGTGLAGLMVEAMRANARRHGFNALVACVRPTSKARYPLQPIERYAAWRRDDGLPFDPWIRLHVRLGGRIVRPVADSMTIAGTIAEWESWTGMRFPDSGDYVVEGGAAAVAIDRERDEGVYLDPNVWIVHAL